MKILLLNTLDQGGGAEKVAFDLHQSYLEQGHDVRLLVRYRRTTAPAVIEADIYQDTLPWARVCATFERGVRRLPHFRGQYRIRDTLRQAAMPQRWFDQYSGMEDFNYPYSHNLLDDPHWRPDIVHTHNLHGNYFDLRALESISKEVPLIWTLHDTWAFTGHCGHFADIGCEGWRNGCGRCPDLHRPPSVRRDRTAENLQIKRDIYAHSQLAIATPSRWLMQYAEQSILQPRWSRVIPNGVDLSVFQPDDRWKSRAVLDLPQDAFVCTFAAQSGADTNPYKDYATVSQAVREVAEQLQESKVLFVCVGSNQTSRSDSRFHYTGYISDPERMALYYQASNVLLHAANAENFPCVVLEASACGIPVIATAVGGIPEQIVDGETGFLVPRKDSVAMAQRIMQLVQQPDMGRLIGWNAAVHVRHNFGLELQVSGYLDWFEELLGDYSKQPATSG
jgi:glycosyltransferase involved in cell wall biosynthesis